MKKREHSLPRASASGGRGANDPDEEIIEKGVPVGYKRPPKHTRFKPGQSGNPKGRPRGTRNFTTDVKATLKAFVEVTRDGIPHRVSTQEAALLRLRAKALSGDARALDRLLGYAQIYGEEEGPSADQISAGEERLLQVYRARVLSGAAEDSPSQMKGSEEVPMSGKSADTETASSASKYTSDRSGRGAK